MEIINLVLEALEHSAGRLGGCGSVYAGFTQGCHPDER